MAVKASIKYLNHGILIRIPNMDGSTEVIQTTNRFRAVVQASRAVNANLMHKGTSEPQASMGEPYDDTLKRAIQFNERAAEAMPEPNVLTFNESQFELLARRERGE